MVASPFAADPVDVRLGAPPSTSSAEVVAKYAEQTDVPVEQARGDLEIQQQAGNVAGVLTERLGGRYAGLYGIHSGGWPVELPRAAAVAGLPAGVDGDAFACVAAPAPTAGQPRQIGLVLARRGGHRQRSRDHSRAVRILERLDLTAAVDVRWTSARFRLSSMAHISRRLFKEGSRLGISTVQAAAVDASHCRPYELLLSSGENPPEAEAWATAQVARYGSDRVRIVRLAPMSAVPQ